MRAPSPLILHRGKSRQQSSQLSTQTPFSSIYATPKREKASLSRIKKLARFLAKVFSRQKKVNSENYDAYSVSSQDQVGDLSYSTSSAGGSRNFISRLIYLSSSSQKSSSSAPSVQLGPVEITLEEIRRATGNFNPANEIGNGGFGTVYKGKLRNRALVAIKRARKDNHDLCLSAEFRNEVLTLSKIEHINLVRLFGYLEEGDERIVVVEYIGNGTLREHLDGKHGNELELAQRLDIAIDVAHAVTYLHSYSDPPIIHRDIKSSNILITEKFHAKVADFGFARLAPEDSDVTHISTQIKGTTGYLDPEYLKTYQLTDKSDVYSFGVLLVEIITARYPIELKRPLQERVTIKWAMRKLKDGEAVIAMDTRLRRSPASVEAVEKVLKLARQCLAPARPFRPSMRTCAEVLWQIRKDFRQKNQSQAPNAIAKDVDMSQDLYEITESDIYRFVSV
ncbi:hypothetical protein Leryth_013293 [Lithospermum erythrorhizon]|nr:hypothetical protein Leryth_013293 [Lithospermum erythrorhizon]